MARTMTKKPVRMREEVAELERYLQNCKEQGQRSLQALRDSAPFTPHINEVYDSGNEAALQDEVDSLRAENARLQEQQQQLQAEVSAHAADPTHGSHHELQARCARLESELAAARTAALTSAARRPRDAHADARGGSGASASTSSAAAPPVAVLQALAAQVAQLKQDRQAIEDTVVEMFESLFSDTVKEQVVSVVRRKENELVASLEASGGGGGGRKNGFAAKPAPRLKQKLDEATERIEKLEKELKNRAAELDAAERHHADMLKIKTLESDAQAEHFKAAWKMELEKRKVLHQRVLELKGAIRVFCRVRPLNQHDGDAASGVVVKDAESLNITIPSLDDRRRAASAPLGGGGSTSSPPRLTGRDFTFEFDRVFGPADTQEAVYEDVSDLIVSVADGYNVCIMAYGQTGSGKTYTMQGAPDNPGINMRALRELFTVAKERAETTKLQVQASILEIYNESIFDLLSDSPRATADKLDIKEVGGHIWIPNLSMVKVHSVEEVEGLIEKGDKGRSTFATDMNDHSSRSHLILSLYVRTDNIVSGEKTASKLHLIDLAGSERVSRSHAAGERLQEAQNINKSLSALGDVIQSLKQQLAHIPYRNCKLTRLLSDSLGGKSKTLLVVNLSPTRDSAAESRCSCEFASRAKRVELGAAVRNVEGAGGGKGEAKGPVRPASMGASARGQGAVTPTRRSQTAADLRSSVRRT